MASKISINKLKWTVPPAGNQSVKVEYWPCPVGGANPDVALAADNVVVLPSGDFETEVAIEDLPEDACYTVRITCKCNNQYVQEIIQTAKTACPLCNGIIATVLNQ